MKTATSGARVLMGRRDARQLRDSEDFTREGETGSGVCTIVGLGLGIGLRVGLGVGDATAGTVTVGGGGGTAGGGLGLHTAGAAQDATYILEATHVS